LPRRFPLDKLENPHEIRNGTAPRRGRRTGLSYTLDEFYGDTRKALKGQPGPAARQTIRKNLERLLGSDEFVAECCGPDAKPGIQVVHRCPETGYNVLVHVYERGKAGPPHDHGNSWAIYGQAAGHTVMTTWKRTDDGREKGHADLAKDQSFRLERGMAGIFEPGQIHSIEISDGSRFVRVTGTDLNAIETLVYNPQTHTVSPGSRL
jgi:predicted metal-dependent enzyme (double-stranded beta helix superfamily)